MELRKTTKNMEGKTRHKTFNAEKDMDLRTTLEDRLLSETEGRGTIL